MMTSTDQLPARPARAPRRPLWRQRLVAVALILVGAVVSVWPVGETFYNNWRGTSATSEYAERVAASDPQVLAGQRRAGADYNRALSPTALTDPWSDEAEASSAAHDAYLSQLSGFGPLGRIRIPAISVDLPILHDATRRSLGLGAGHMYGTSLPVGGLGTHAVIAGHTGSTVRTYFDRLKELGEGAVFFIDVAGETLAYRVDRVSVVWADDLSLIQPEPDRDLVTLVTCIQGSAGKGKRLLVRGTRDTTLVPASTPAATSGMPGTTNQPGVAAASVAVDLSVTDWMWPRLALAAGAVALVLAMGLSWLIGAARRGRPVGTPAPAGPADPRISEREDPQP